MALTAPEYIIMRLKPSYYASNISLYVLIKTNEFNILKLSAHFFYWTEVLNTQNRNMSMELTKSNVWNT